MRICLLGDFGGNPDEGMKGTSQNIRKYLSDYNHDIITLHPRDAIQPGMILRLKKWKPEIIHYLHGPSLKSLVIMALLKKFIPEAKTISLAIKPEFKKRSLFFLQFFKPDLVLVQSHDSEQFFRESGFQTSFFPLGIDLKRYYPMPPEKRADLRQKYRVDKNAFVVLHVGHAKKSRNLEILADVQKIEGVQVIVAASPALTREKEVEDLLKKSGVIVWRKYFENLNEIYNCADCYLFPTRPPKGRFATDKSGCCETPFSVLEAMACNLPVVTTRLGALQRLFEPGDGLYYCDDEDDIINHVKQNSSQDLCKTREKVLPYNWEKAVILLESAYRNILH